MAGARRARIGAAAARGGRGRHQGGAAVRGLLRAGGCLAGVMAVAGCMAAGGDYGDAPDGAPTGYAEPFAQTGQFPTREASGGPAASDVSVMVLGSAASAEDGPEDPEDPDGRPNLAPVDTDSDDGSEEFTLQLVSAPPTAQAGFAVSAHPESEGGKFYLNVLLDLNGDGRWGGGADGDLPEWVVQNLAVTVTPGTTAFVRPPLFRYGGPRGVPEASWMRAALTREPIAGAIWEGGGQFEAGEIEDYLMRLPRPGGQCSAIPLLECPKRVGLQGADTATFSCTLTNLRGCAGPVNYSLTRHDGGVKIRPEEGAYSDFLAGGPATLGAAPDAPDNAVLLTFTAQRGALPSRWGYRAWVEGNPGKPAPEPGAIGFGDSTGEIEFVQEE